MKEGDIIICKNQQYFGTVVVVGDMYEIMKIVNKSFVIGTKDVSYLHVKHIKTKKIINFLPPFLFITLDEHRESILEKILD